MKKLLTGGLIILAWCGLAMAQPANGPTPVPTPPKPEKPKTEKVGKDESLQHGGDTRPWAAGVSAENQRIALEKFRQANTVLNDGLWANAAKLYREALQKWDHPAIHYNLALALLNLDQPIEVYDSLQKA